MPAKQERVRQSERVKAGLDRATKSRAKFGCPKVSQLNIEKVKRLRRNRLSIRKMAILTKLSIGKIGQMSRS